MAKIVVLGGYGQMGRVISTDLSKTFNGEITIAGRAAAKKAKALLPTLNSKRIKLAFADSADRDSMDRVLDGADVLVNATNYYSNLEVMEHCLRNSVSYLDLGGLYHTTLKQLKLDSRFRKKKVLALLGCGSTPGITNVMAAHVARDFERIDSVHIQFADKDYTDYHMPFVVPYSMYTVRDEFSKKPAVLSNGKIKFVEPFSGSTAIPFPQPVGKVECFYTLHSELATLPGRFRSKGIKECSFRGGFDSGFVSQVRFLINSGLMDGSPVKLFHGERVRPIDVTVRMLNRFIPGNEVKINDVEFLRVEITGKRKGKRRKVVMLCKSKTEKRHNIPAGSWDTGVPPSIIAQMIVNKEIDSIGVKPLDDPCINSELFFRKLKLRNMTISEVLS